MANRIQAGRNPEESFLMRTMGAVFSGVISAACLYGGGTWLNDGNWKGSAMTIGGIAGLACVALAVPLANEGMKAVAASGERLLNRTTDLRTVGGSLISGLVHAAAALPFAYYLGWDVPAKTLAGFAGFLVGFVQGVSSRAAPAPRRLGQQPAPVAAAAAPLPRRLAFGAAPAPLRRPVAANAAQFEAVFEDGRPFRFEMEGRQYRAYSVTNAFEQLINSRNNLDDNDRIEYYAYLLQQLFIGKILSNENLIEQFVGTIDQRTGIWVPDLSTRQSREQQADEWDEIYGAINYERMDFPVGAILVNAVRSIRERIEAAIRQQARPWRRAPAGGAGVGGAYQRPLRRQWAGAQQPMFAGGLPRMGARAIPRGGDRRVHFDDLFNDSDSGEDF